MCYSSWILTLYTVTAAAEGAGKLLLNQGLTSSFRPRKYYTLPKETVEGILEDLEQLSDFFLIEFQRILFAENVIHTAAVCYSMFFFFVFCRVRWLGIAIDC